MKDSQDMFDTSGDSQDQQSSLVNEDCLAWSGVPFSSLPRLHPHGSATPAPPPVPGPFHTVAVKLPLQVNVKRKFKSIAGDLLCTLFFFFPLRGDVKYYLADFVR